MCSALPGSPPPDPRPDFQDFRPSPTPQPSPTPGGAPLSGPFSGPSADRFRLGLFPPGSPFLCLPGAPPFSDLFLSPFPFRPPSADHWPPPGFAGLLTPRPSPGPLAGRPGPVLPLAPAFPAGSGCGAPQEPPSSHSQPSAPPGACGHPLTGSRFPPFLGPGPFLACSGSLHSQAWAPSSRQPCPWILSTSGPPRCSWTLSGLFLSQEALASQLPGPQPSPGLLGPGPV